MATINHKRKISQLKEYRDRKNQLALHEVGYYKFLAMWDEFIYPTLVDKAKSFSKKDAQSILDIRRKAGDMFIFCKHRYLLNYEDPAKQALILAKQKAYLFKLFNDHHEITLKYLMDIDICSEDDLDARLSALNESAFRFSMLKSKDSLPVLSSYLASSTEYFKNKKAFQAQKSEVKSMNSTRDLSDIINKYCNQYKELLDDNTLELVARFQSYNNLLKIYPINKINSLVYSMIDEVDVHSLQNPEGMYTKLLRMFDVINDFTFSNQLNLPDGEIDEDQEKLSVTFLIVDDIISLVAKNVNKLLVELKPTTAKKVKETSTPKRFEELFEFDYSSPNHIIQFVNILHNVDPSLINADREWIVKDGKAQYPSAARVFFNSMIQHGVFKKGITPSQAGPIFSKYFKNLNEFGVNGKILQKVEDHFINIAGPSNIDENIIKVKNRIKEGLSQ